MDAYIHIHEHAKAYTHVHVCTNIPPLILLVFLINRLIEYHDIYEYYTNTVRYVHLLLC